MSEISERILELIKQSNTSYGDLSKITGIPKSALQRYAIGETEKIPLDRLEKIAAALHVSAAYLMGWEYDEATTSPDMLAFMEMVSAEHQSGREDAREAMRKTHGVENSTQSLRFINGKYVFMYYHAFDDQRSSSAALALMDLLEKLTPSEAEHLELLAEAYTAADERARRLVDYALDTEPDYLMEQLSPAFRGPRAGSQRSIRTAMNQKRPYTRKNRGGRTGFKPNFNNGDEQAEETGGNNGALMQGIEKRGADEEE